jgi:adenylate cyclase
MTVQQIGRELGVRYILEGSSRRAGERVRVTAQLVDAETGRHLWAERYDRELADLFAVQDEIVACVVGAIEPEMLRTETLRARQKSPQDLSAWDQIFRGMWHFYQVTERDHMRARELFRGVVATAPALAEGHTWLARVNAGILIYGWSKTSAADTAEGWQAAMRATRLADADPYAHYALGIMSAAMGQPDRAAAEAQKAIDLSPNFALGWLLLGMGRLFAGRAAQAIEPLQRGLRLNPQDPQAFTWLLLLAFAHLLSSAHEEAAQRAREAVAMRPEWASGQAALACALARLGRAEEARAAVSGLEQALTDSGNSFDELFARFNQADRERLLADLRAAGWRG